MLVKKHLHSANNEDIALLDELDEIFRGKLIEAEESGISREDLLELAQKYGRMYDLVDARFAKIPVDYESEAFKNETIEFVGDGFFEKIHKVYEPSPYTNEEHVRRVVRLTRRKLGRIRKALFSY